MPPEETLEAIERANPDWNITPKTDSSSITSPSRDTMLSKSVNTSNNKSDDVVPAVVLGVPVIRKDHNIIDVVREYDWTFSKNKNLRDEVPYIRIHEFKLAANTYLSSLITSVLLFPSAMEKNVQPVKNAVEAISKLIPKSETFDKFMGGLTDLKDGVSNFASNVSNTLNLKARFGDVNTDNWPDDIKDHYSQLYIRKATGQSYIFPYFSSDYYSIANTFSDTFDSVNNPSILGEMMSNVSKVINEYSQRWSAAALTEPGMYVQRPKFYDFATDGKTIDVEFYLYNTLNPNSYYKNMELLTKLIIQNTPRRYSRLLVDPPCIYEVDVPGRCFYPYAFISSLNVNFVGTKRMIEDRIVPDAFKVTIQFKSLTTEVNNFLVPNMGDGGIDVTTRYRTEGFGIFKGPNDFTGDTIKVGASSGLDLRNITRGIA